MVRNLGYKHYMKANAWYRVLLEHKHTKNEAIEEAEMATDHIFDDTDIEMYEELVEKVEQGKHFDTVTLRCDLRMDVTAHDVDDAYGEVVGMVREIQLPPCVKLEEVEPYYAEQDTEPMLDITEEAM